MYIAKHLQSLNHFSSQVCLSVSVSAYLQLKFVVFTLKLISVQEQSNQKFLGFILYWLKCSLIVTFIFQKTN